VSRLLHSTRAFFDGRSKAAGEAFDANGRLRTSRRANILRNPEWRRAATGRFRRLAQVRFDPDALIRVPNELSRLTLEMLDAVAPAVSKAYQEHLVPVGEGADENWPVDTGFSRSLFTLFFERRGDTVFRGVFRGGAEYTYLIRFAGRRGAKDAEGKRPLEPRRHVWTVLITRPAERRALPAMQRDIGEDLVRG
jgi:hypothetical protein